MIKSRGLRRIFAERRAGQSDGTEPRVGDRLDISAHESEQDAIHLSLQVCNAPGSDLRRRRSSRDLGFADPSGSANVIEARIQYIGRERRFDSLHFPSDYQATGLVIRPCRGGRLKCNAKFACGSRLSPSSFPLLSAACRRARFSQ